MSYMIFVNNSEDFKIDPREFAERLREKWSNAQITIIHNDSDSRILEWDVRNAIDEWVHGYILRNSQDFINVDTSPIEDIALFAFWYRRLVPREYQLVLFHPSWDGRVSVVIDSTTTIESISNQLERCENFAGE
jgi:hypothetical protein